MKIMELLTKLDDSYRVDSRDNEVKISKGSKCMFFKHNEDINEYHFFNYFDSDSTQTSEMSVYDDLMPGSIKSKNLIREGLTKGMLPESTEKRSFIGGGRTLEDSEKLEEVMPSSSANIAFGNGNDPLKQGKPEGLIPGHEDPIFGIDRSKNIKKNKGKHGRVPGARFDPTMPTFDPDEGSEPDPDHYQKPGSNRFF